MSLWLHLHMHLQCTTVCTIVKTIKQSLSRSLVLLFGLCKWSDHILTHAVHAACSQAIAGPSNSDTHSGTPSCDANFADVNADWPDPTMDTYESRQCRAEYSVMNLGIGPQWTNTKAPCYKENKCRMRPLGFPTSLGPDGPRETHTVTL